MNRPLLSSMILLIAVVALASGRDPQKDTIAEFYQLRERTLDQRGTQADVEKLLALLTDDVVYEHPHSRVTMSKEQARDGMRAHLNEGKDARFTVRSVMQGRDFAVVEFRLEYTLPKEAGGEERVERIGATIFEFDGAKINRVAVY